MTDRTRDEENASPAQLPLFAESSATSKKRRGRTYSRPKEAKTRRSISGTKKRRKKSSSNGRRRSNGGNDGVPRCALQTLGGSRTAGAMKGGLGLSNANEATLKKMRGYGGALFHDKCYLSSDDDDGGLGAARTPSWTLSPPSDGDDETPFTSGADAGGKRLSKKAAKKTSKATAAVPSPGIKPLPLSSSSASSSRRGSGTSTRSSSNSRRQNPYELGTSSGEEDDSEVEEVRGARAGAGGDGGQDSESSEEEQATPSASTNRKKSRSERPVASTPRARQRPAATEPSKTHAGHTTKAKPFRTRGSNASATNTIADSPPVSGKKAEEMAPAAASPTGAGGGGTTTTHRPVPSSTSRGKGRSAVIVGKDVKRPSR